MGSTKSREVEVMIVEAAGAAARPGAHFPILIAVLFFLFAAADTFAQGGPPYYTNDPGTPGHLNWEINVGYMPFL
jgi:hypothetical protein